MKILHAVDIGRKQPKCYIFSGNRIYLGWVNDSARGLVRIRLEVWIGAEKRSDTRLLAAARGACADSLSVREISGQFRRRENRSQSGGIVLGKLLSLVSTEKE